MLNHFKLKDVMKKNFVIYACAALALCGQTACSDFLEEDTRGKVFSNVLAEQSGLESALTGAYTGWSSTWAYGFTNGWATETTLGGDDLTCPPGTGNTQEFDRFDVKDTNSSIPSVFQGCYKAIQGANNVLENYQSCSGDPAVIEQIAAEALFIRAASYFWLVRMHGEVPLVLSSEYNEANVTMERASVRAIYDRIERDLTDAIKVLPDARRNGEDGRPNKGTALALLAEVYLAEAGWPLKETDKYSLAASTAKQVLDNRALYGFDFEDSYDVLYGNDESDPNIINKEDIWVIPCNRSTGHGNAMYAYWAYPGEIGGWDVVFAELTFYNEFPEGPRKDATFALEFTSQDGTHFTWQQLANPRPYYRKLMQDPASSNFFNSESNIPMRMLRFSQTALTYAEAKARSGEGVDALAYECLNTIRTRAGLPTYSGLSAEDFANKCVDERAWELCGERVRWFDLVRLEILADVVAKRDPADNPPINAITEDVYLFPIPEHDGLLNPSLNN